MPLKNKGIKGCTLCQNPKISNITDPILFDAEMSHKDLHEKLRIQNGYMVELTDIKAHARHIFFEPDNTKELQDTKFSEVSTKKTIELVNEELASLCVSLDTYRSNGMDATLEFSKMQKTKIELLNIKAKIEGEINDNVIMVPSWLKEMEEHDDS